MPVTEWLNNVVPQIGVTLDANIKAKDPFFDKVMKGGKVINLNGFESHRVKHIYGRAALPQFFNAQQAQLTFQPMPGLESTELNVLEFKLTIAIPNILLTRLNPSQQREYVTDIMKRAAIQHYMVMLQRTWSGSLIDTTLDAPYLQIPTFNGFKTDCTTPGLPNGIIRFETPATQSGAATYLFARYNDTGTKTNNWYNQGASFGTAQDFSNLVPYIVRQAAEWTDVEMGNVGINPSATQFNMSYDTWLWFQNAMKFTPNTGQPTMMYTQADFNAGKVNLAATMVAGIPALPSRWFIDSEFTGMTYPMMGISAQDLHHLRNGKYGLDFNPKGMSDFTDIEQYTGIASTIAFWKFSGAFFTPNLMRQMALWKA